MSRLGFYKSGPIFLALWVWRTHHSLFSTSRHTTPSYPFTLPRVSTDTSITSFTSHLLLSLSHTSPTLLPIFFILCCLIITCGSKRTVLRTTQLRTQWAICSSDFRLWLFHTETTWTMTTEIVRFDYCFFVKFTEVRRSIIPIRAQPSNQHKHSASS